MTLACPRGGIESAQVTLSLALGVSKRPRFPSCALPLILIWTNLVLDPAGPWAAGEVLIASVASSVCTDSGDAGVLTTTRLGRRGFGERLRLRSSA